MNRSIRILSATTAFAALVFPTSSWSQEEPAPEPQPLTEAMQAELDGMLAELDAEREDASAAATRLATIDDQYREIISIRLTEDWIDVLRTGTRFARAVLAHRDDGYIVDAYADQAVAALETHEDVYRDAIAEINSRTALPDAELGAAQLAAAYERFFNAAQNHDELLVLMSDTLSMLEALGADVAAAEVEFSDILSERAINVSIFLGLSQREADGIRAGLDALPGDAELTGKLNVAETRIARTAGSLGNVIELLAERDIDVSAYRQQLVVATGTIAAEDLNVSVVGNLLSQWSGTLMTRLAAEGPGLLFRLLIVAIIVFVFYKVSRLARHLAERGLNRSHAAISQLLHRMIISVVGNLVLALGILIALSQVGISLGPVLAGLGIAGFVIGFALQDSLSNFASGMMILFTRPYDVGDIVEIGGVLGNVEEMSLVNTTIHTFDNQRIILPNTMIWGGVIKNVTAQRVRRVDLLFGISYSDDIPKTEKILNEILEQNDLVLDDPEPIVRLHELGDSSVNFVVRPWVKTEDYWPVYWAITRSVKLRFDEEGISIPFPQRDVHLIREKTPEV